MLAQPTLFISASEVIFASAINCIGAWSNCTTMAGELKCKVRFGVSPFQPTVCRVSNACIAGNELELYSDAPQTRAFHGEELAMSPFAARVERGAAGNIRLKVRPASEIPPAADPVFDSVPAVLVQNVENHNVGHVYGDEVWPAFQMLHRYNFDWHNKQFRLVLRKMQEAYKPKVHELVSDHAPAHIQGQQRQCFKELFVGCNALSYSESSPDPHALGRFRDFLLHRAHKKWDIHPQASAGGFSDRKDPNILVVLKDVEHSAHPTLVTNYESAVEALKQQFPALKISMLKWHGKSQKQQVQIMQNTDILYSQPGSDVMNALFLPAGSSLLTPCRALDANWLVSSKATQKPPSKVLIEYGNEVRIWFNAMPDMRCVQVCGDEDIAFETGKFMVPATLNSTNLIKTMRVVIDDWQQRRQIRLLESV